MRRNIALQRKVIYLAAMALLLAPLSYVSRPATTEDSGGKLAQMRQEHRLSPAQLGEIDPVGASMNLATLGLRGPAALLLWHKALGYKETEDWSSMKATLNQMTKLQPNYISVWRFQAWELSYNVAAEFDDQRHRYTWVKKGVEFLKQGARYNRNEPLLVWDMGWFFGHKLGRSDDRRQFRQFYRDDTDFHETLPIDIDRTRGPDNKPDNWLAAHRLYRQSQQMVDTSNVPLRGKNPLLFHGDPAMALIYHAIAIEDDGYLDEKGQNAWRIAGEEFREFGNRSLPTKLRQQVRLNDYERMEAEASKEAAVLDSLVPGARDAIIAELRKELPADQLEALDTDPLERNGVQQDLADEALRKLNVNPLEIAKRAEPSRRPDATRSANRLINFMLLAETIDGYRTTVNFQYWKTRCQAEQEETTIQARRNIQQAVAAHDRANLDLAKELYEKAWDAWALIYSKYPILMDDPTAEDVVDSIKRYRDLLSQMNERFPPPGFKLHTLLEIHDSNYRAPLEDSTDAPTNGT